MENQFLKGRPKIARSNKHFFGTVVDSTFGPDAENFSGTARYEIDFKRPDGDADNWSLDLGDVRESAKVWLNDQFIGDAWSVPFTLEIGKLQEDNTLVIEVTNLPANRIRAKEMRGEEWMIFHDINMVDKNYKEFDATKWNLMPSGLLSDVWLTPLKLTNND